MILRKWFSKSLSCRQSSRRPDQLVDAVDQGGAVRRRRLISMLQSGRLVGQHMAGRPFTNCLHLVKQHVVGSVLQRQQLADDTVFQQPLSCRRNWTIPSEYLQVRK